MTNDPANMHNTADLTKENSTYIAAKTDILLQLTLHLLANNMEASFLNTVYSSRTMPPVAANTNSEKHALSTSRMHSL